VRGRLEALYPSDICHTDILETFAGDVALAPIEVVLRRFPRSAGK